MLQVFPKHGANTRGTRALVHTGHTLEGAARPDLSSREFVRRLGAISFRGIIACFDTSDSLSVQNHTPGPVSLPAGLLHTGKVAVQRL